MGNKLQGKVALITGSGRGIGRELALMLAKDGAHIVVNDLDIDPANQTVADIIGMGGKAVACTGSVTDDDFADRFINTALDTFGGLDIIVNNAGGSLMFEYSPSVKFKVHNNILVSNTAGVNNIASIGSPSTSGHLFNNNTIISKGKNVYFGGSSSYHANNITFTNNLFGNSSNNDIIDIK